MGYCSKVEHEVAWWVRYLRPGWVDGERSVFRSSRLPRSHSADFFLPLAHPLQKSFISSELVNQLRKTHLSATLQTQFATHPQGNRIAMAPHTPAVHPSDLHSAILTQPASINTPSVTAGTRRRDLPHDFDLKRDCKLQSLMQYNCEAVEVPGKKFPIIECTEVERLFRKCKNGMMVETTSWEGVQTQQANTNDSS